MRIDVFKAQRLTDRSDPTPDLIVNATVEHPTLPTLKDAAKLHTEQGRALGEALFTHLAGGTLDALLSYMLERRASLLVVRFDA